ncbi:MAG: FecR domain-containing protein [Anaerolineae bacterium]
MILLYLPVTAATAAAPATQTSEDAWVLVDIIDHEYPDHWEKADAHPSYAVSHSYSRGSYSASTTYEGDDPYSQGLAGTLGLKAVFTGVPEIIYPDQPVSLNLSFTAAENSVVKLSFSGWASADFDQWDVGAGSRTGGQRSFVNADGDDSFVINAINGPFSYNETLTAQLGAGSEGSRIALRTRFSMDAPMGTNYIFEWQQAGESAVAPTATSEPTKAPKPTAAPSPTQEASSGIWSWWGSRETVPTKASDTKLENRIVRFGDLHGEVNVKRYGEDDDSYVFCDLNTPLQHGDVIKVLPKSGAILSFSDMTSVVLKEDTVVVLDIANEEETLVGVLAGRIWVNLKRMAEDGSMEVEMSQAVAGIKGTIISASVTEDGNEIYVFTSSATVTSKTTGETITLEPGQMALVDKSGEIQLNDFDIEVEAEKLGIPMKDLKADGYGRSTNWLLWIVSVVVILATVVIVVLLLGKKKRGQIPLAQAAAAQYINQSYQPGQQVQQGPTRFCPHCGNPIHGEQQFCQHCGQQVKWTTDN